MKPMNAALANWGPELLVCFTVVIGIVYNSSRFSDLRSYMDARFNANDKRIEDLKDFLRSEIRRLEERSSPIHRP